MRNHPSLLLVSHHLCPYVQRAAIVAAEQGLELGRVSIDLANKPGWFKALSPTGKVPLLRVDDEVLFESAPIVEYLNDISSRSLHPEDPLRRARHRAWIDFASGTLDEIAGLYSAPDAATFEAKRSRLNGRFAQLERAIRPGPWFDGECFHIVDAVWAPVFRYFDVIDPVVELQLFSGRTKMSDWRGALASRPSAQAAVVEDYPARLAAFFRARPGHLGALFRQAATST